MYYKFQVVLLNPTPKWRFEGLHVDKRSGLPCPEIHNEMLHNFFYCLARVACNRRICTLGGNASRANRNIKEQLNEGCAMLYKRGFGQICWHPEGMHIASRYMLGGDYLKKFFFGNSLSPAPESIFWEYLLNKYYIFTCKLYPLS